MYPLPYSNGVVMLGHAIMMVYLWTELGTLCILIAPLCYIPAVYTKYFAMYKVHMHAGATRRLLYG